MRYLFSPLLVTSDRLNDIFEREFWVRFWHELTGEVLHSLIQIAGILVAYLVLRALANKVIDGVLARIMAREVSHGLSPERTGRLQTIQGLTKSLVGYIFFFVFGVLFFKAVGFDIMPFITTAGVIGLAVGFGAQKLVKDVISGFFIIIDNVFVVGDMVTIGAVTGQVIEMGMRVTRVQDAGGRLFILANGDIGTVTNLSRNPVQDVIEVGIAAAADLTAATRAINAAGEALFEGGEHRLKAAPSVLGITAFSLASVTVRVSVVSEPRDLPEEQMKVRAAVRDALIAAQIPLA